MPDLYGHSIGLVRVAPSLDLRGLPSSLGRERTRRGAVDRSIQTQFALALTLSGASLEM